MQIDTVGVIGLGTMGAGIAEVFGRAGLSVVAIEADHAALSAGRARLEESLQRSVDRGRMSVTERDDALRGFTFTTDLGRLAATDLVIEAVPERLAMKVDVFGHVDRICPPHTVLATNTSSLPVTQIAAATGRPGRVIGMHFFNPAPVMRLVEVVHSVLTDPDVVGAVHAFANRCGKTPVVVADRAGFVVNALLIGYLNQAARMAETGHARVPDIDAAITAATGMPMGPLTLMDLIGLDVCLEVLEVLWDENRDRRFAAAPLLRRLVMAGDLGRKSGRGYYDYSASTPAPSVEIPAAEPVRRGRGGACRVAVTGAEDAPALAESVEASGGAVEEADVVVHVPHAPRPGRVAEVAAVTVDGLAALDGIVARVAETGVLPIHCRHRPGYVVEALVFAHLNDAAAMVDDGYADRDDVDTAMRLGCGYPDGPFAMLDAVGADAVRAALPGLGVTPAALLADLAGP